MVGWLWLYDTPHVVSQSTNGRGSQAWACVMSSPMLGGVPGHRLGRCGSGSRLWSFWRPMREYTMGWFDLGYRRLSPLVGQRMICSGIWLGLSNSADLWLIAYQVQVVVLGRERLADPVGIGAAPSGIEPLRWACFRRAKTIPIPKAQKGEIPLEARHTEQSRKNNSRRRPAKTSPTPLVRVIGHGRLSRTGAGERQPILDPPRPSIRITASPLRNHLSHRETYSPMPTVTRTLLVKPGRTFHESLHRLHRGPHKPQA